MLDVPSCFECHPFLAFTPQDLDEATKHILEALDQRKLQEVGEKAGVGKFRTASLEKNKKLSMFGSDQTTKSTGKPPFIKYLVKFNCSHSHLHVR